MRDKDEALAAVFAEKAVRRGSPSASTPFTPELLHLTSTWRADGIRRSKLSRIGNSGCIQVSSFGAWIAMDGI